MTAMTSPMSEPPRRGRIRATARAIWAVFCLFVGAIDALVTAVLGVTPLAGPWARVRRVVADQWWLAYYDARDAELVGEETEDV
ncbi:hypothetical protein [Actinomadura sp. DC4]|uniref:hypothetical protein n=1 Tax=Actinomadura sp. DC4 TaxID=3055069 RepID=UPI0025AF623E|nr:hypothetical protein [Actinomadura sp. DC4]MDN3356109.1 hypothetical protein [Actinomadura sp. DC4]